MTRSDSPHRQRCLALWLPHLPTDRLRREKGGAAPAEPLVTVEKIRGALGLAAVDARARELGLMPGLRLADARARVPGITVAPHGPAADRAMLERLADACERYTPLVGLDAPDGLLLDITGCSHLFGGEAAMLAEAVDWLRRLGFTARVAIAGAAAPARALARWGAGGVVAEGEEAAAVAPLPVAALDPAPEARDGLARAGLRTLGDLAARPRAPLAARFGGDLVATLDAVLGSGRRPISPRRPVPSLMAEQRFPEPIGDHASVRACLGQLAEDICSQLARKGEGGRRFAARFFRADGHVRRLAVDTARPLRDPTSLLRLFDTRLDSLAEPLDADCGFDVLRLGVLAAEPVAITQFGFDGGEEEDKALPALAERLSARLGADSLRRFRPVDSHDPDRAQRSVPAIHGLSAALPWTRPEPGEPPSRPLLLFDPPQPIETLAEVPDGPPLRFRWRRVLHEVARAEGPERIAPEWWRRDDAALTRDYYRIEDSHGRRFWLFRAGLYGESASPPRWFLHGLFP